jgi:hypothetical protein
MMASVHESLHAQGPELIDRYPGDDPLLALEYRIALQVILSHKLALLDEAMTADEPGHDTPIHKLAEEYEIAMTEEQSCLDAPETLTEDEPYDDFSFLEFQERLKRLTQQLNRELVNTDTARQQMNGAISNTQLTLSGMTDIPDLDE